MFTVALFVLFSKAALLLYYKTTKETPVVSRQKNKASMWIKVGLTGFSETFIQQQINIYFDDTSGTVLRKESYRRNIRTNVWL